MYAKFPFYSVAQLYAITLDEPVYILFGDDHLYWVVDSCTASEFLHKGCSLLNIAC